MLMHVIAHRGCMDTIQESASEADSGKKNPLSYQELELC